MIDVTMENGQVFRLKADEVLYSPTDNIYYFFRKGIRVGYFNAAYVEWIAPAEKGE